MFNHAHRNKRNLAVFKMHLNRIGPSWTPPYLQRVTCNTSAACKPPPTTALLSTPPPQWPQFTIA